MAHDKLNKIASLHLKASGVGAKDDTHPDTDKVNGSDTPKNKKKGPKEDANGADVKEVPVTSKPKGLK